MKQEDVKVGIHVTYWGVIKNDGSKFDPFQTVIVSEPWQLGGGEIVCKVIGKSGGVSIRHLDILEIPDCCTECGKPMDATEHNYGTEDLLVCIHCLNDGNVNGDDDSFTM